VNSTSRVIPAVRSRCLGIRVAAPTHPEIISILQNICKREGLTLPESFAGRLAIKSERNLRRAILMLEACKVQQYPFTAHQEIVELDWQVYLKETANQIISEQTPQKLEKVRERLYELLSQGVPPEIIFKGLVENLVKNCDMSIKAKILEFATLYEYRMISGSKHIFHLEAFVANFMNIYKKFLCESMMLDDF